jgi:hypothetical protein
VSKFILAIFSILVLAIVVSFGTSMGYGTNSSTESVTVHTVSTTYSNSEYIKSQIENNNYTIKVNSIDKYVFGSYTAIAVGTDGLPIIAYTDNLHYQLRLIHCTDFSCTTFDTLRSLFSAGGFGGAFSSIKIAGDGLPVIVFVEQSSGNLDAIHCMNISCSTSNLSRMIVKEIVGGSSMAIGKDGFPVISYESVTTGLTVIHCTNVSCSTVNNSTNLDNMGKITTPSIEIGNDGFPVIAYQRYVSPIQKNSNLTLIHCRDISCSKFDAPIILDNMGVAASNPSITKGKDGFPVISYEQYLYQNNIPSGILKLVHCTSVSCNTFDTPRTLDNTVDVEGFMPISTDKNGFPVIVYQDFNYGKLQMIHCADISCNTLDNPITIDSSLDRVGFYISMAKERGDDYVICYDDSTSGDIKISLIENHEINRTNSTATAYSNSTFVTPNPATNNSPAVIQKKIVPNNAVSIISIQPVDQQGNSVSSFAKGINGFVNLTLLSQSNQTVLTTVDLIDSDLTSIGVGSIITVLNQTVSEMTLSFFIPNTAANGTAKICVDVFSDWPEKGGIPLAVESCIPVQIAQSTFSTHDISLQEAIGISDTIQQNVTNAEFTCTPTYKTPDVQLTRDNYTTSTVSLKACQKLFPLFVQKIYSDHVIGLQYFAFPVCCPFDSITLHVGDSVGGGCTVPKLTLLTIQGGRAIFSMGGGGGGYPGRCPICLSGNTSIDTLHGVVNIKGLKIGMAVWTADVLGHREIATILKAGKTLVPATHKMVHVVLDDGRELYASQGHPTADGRFLGELKVGDIIDHSRIKSIELVSYNANYTYDILPSGATGYYWADGILVGSTLK